MNLEESDKANAYHEKKKLKAEEEKAKDDANKWWEENNKRFQDMNVKDCHDFLKNCFPSYNTREINGVRPKVYWILLEKLKQWKGNPPLTPPQPQIFKFPD